jgi:PDZ domain
MTRPKLLHWRLLLVAAGATTIRTPRGWQGARVVLLVACSALVSGFLGLPAHADSKSAAEFTLKTCSDAMDDFAKVEATARDNSWQILSQPIPPAMTKYMRARSMWTVRQGDETYMVSIWESLNGEEQKLPPRKVCAVSFPNKTVKRDEFFDLAFVGMDLTFAADTRMPQLRTERYEINRYRPNNVHFSITSTLDGIVSTVMMQEMYTFAVPSLSLRYGRLGVKFRRVTNDITAALPLKSARGVLVEDIDEIGAAKPAGIQVGDVITRMDGKEIYDVLDLPRIVAETPANKKVEVVIVRGGEERSLSVTLGP